MKINQFSPRAAQGIVLIITLFVLVVMTLASVAIIRSMDVNALAVAGHTFRSAGNASEINIIENVIRDLIATANNESLRPSLQANQTAGANKPWNYYASIQAPTQESAEGIPLLLQSKPNGSDVVRYQDTHTPGVGSEAWVLVERMCQAPGPANTTNCIVVDDGGGSSGNSLTNLANDVDAAKISMVVNGGGTVKVPYRVTVRIDGPNNTVSFTQAIVNLLS
ncbi:MAG: hypothetical protein LBG61_00595 [Burkholderiales bacterium]|jgi:hypothetical protein|nr:hypothetical protein [Burkholderiales bacterium]